MTQPPELQNRAAQKAWVRALERSASAARLPHNTLPVAIEACAQEFGTAPALLSEEASFTFIELAQRCRRYARWALSLGLARGDVIALVAENSPDYFAAWLGLTRVGVVVALVNSNLRADALAHSISLVAPRHIILGVTLWTTLESELRGHGVPLWCQGEAGASASLEDALAVQSAEAPLSEQECALPQSADRALFIYTSGTTGLPKAANVSHFRVMQWSQWFAGLLDTKPSDRMYDCLPMYHSVGGIVAIGATLVSGGSVVVRRRFSASHFWEDIAQWQCTLFQYIGELCRILANAPEREAEHAHQLRAVCGNGLAPDVWPRFRERFAIAQILEFYAATEANFSLYNVEGKEGAIGRVPPFLAHRFPVALVRFDVEAGEPLRDAAGHCVRCEVDEAGEAISQIAQDATQPGRRFEGYTDERASRSKVLRDVFQHGDLWYRSGDLMRRDRAGFFYFVDRVGDTFRWKGENVSTGEVAAIVGQCPGVSDALVYGVAVPGHDGRAGMAALVTQAPFELASLLRHLELHLPRYAWPQFLRLSRGFELTETFKPKKQGLVQAGFVPDASGDGYFVLEAQTPCYVPIDAAVLASLAGGTWRF